MAKITKKKTKSLFSNRENFVLGITDHHFHFIYDYYTDRLVSFSFFDVNFKKKFS